MAIPVIMPRQGQSVESCILVEWLVAVGDSVTAGQSLANIETDKAVFEVESPEAGTILNFFFEPGDDIPVLTTIAAMGAAGDDGAALSPNATAAPAAAAEAPAAEPDAPAAAETPAPVDTPAAATPAPAATGGTLTGVSPRARQRAAKSGLDPQTVQGTGPAGRVIERDVVAAIAAHPGISGVAADAIAAGAGQAPAVGSGPGGRVLSKDITTGAPAPAAASAAAPVVATGETVTIPVTGIRKIIAERMRNSLATTAQLTLNMSFDATAVLAYRKSVKAHAEALGLPNITLNDMVVFAAARTLTRHPELNAHFLGDRIVRYPHVNIGIAMDTPRGLMVPVLNNAHARSLSDISLSIKPIVEDAQKGTINPDMLQGGTFTITNMGMLGIESFTPVLNAPEVAILGVGGLFLKPVAKDGDVAHVQAINLSLTIDHQATDGAPGARFLKDLCTMLENFELALA
ncbi:MAG: pyruvate dehydrogenase E2 component (dihydrolipoamide acetyltransferase) [Kiritimatiellia bacterium]|jgi:pyruvate dehydrogenase E2 component (dihydrolipoamide acetyltransferase)